MGIACLESCSACQRHVRCAERVCPFCGARLEVFMRVADYRLKSALGRSQLVGLGAALTAAGITVACELNPVPMYGIPCTPPDCGSGSAPAAGTGGRANAGNGGASGDGDDGGAGGEHGGAR